MKTRFAIAALAVGMFLSVGVSAFADNETRLIDAKIKNLFVPFGYDDNDEVVVVVEGYLPDTCYKLANTEVQKQGNSIVVTQKAREFQGTCFDVTVPFTTTVKLGALAQGEYNVTVNQGALSDKLAVKESTKAGPDDYLYAPVEAARVETNSAVLQGRYTNNCLSIEDVKLFHTGKTVQVLPVMKLMTPSESGHACEAGEFPFTQNVKLESLKLDAGRHLLHVRSLDGQSVNTVFTVSER